MCFVSNQAYDIRMDAIHEFDPWFNYRATEYLAANGWHALFHWLDYMSWYPALGRPIGTTIYPGMQITAARPRPPPPAAVSAAALEPLPVSESRQQWFESATARSPASWRRARATPRGRRGSERGRRVP